MAHTEKHSNPTTANTWGGAREGAGRPKSSPFVSHNKRPRIDNLNKPVKITFRLRSQLPDLRSEDLYSTFHRACLRARGTGLRINHFSLDSGKIHLICEFKNQEELEKSLKSLSTTLAIAVKRKYRQDNPTLPPHKGPVFLGRFMMEVIRDAVHYKVVLKELYLPSLAEKDSSTVNRFKTSSAIIFQKWTKLFSDDNTETRQFIKSSAKFIETEKYLPYKRIAQEICSTPIFSISRNFET